VNQVETGIALSAKSSGRSKIARSRQMRYSGGKGMVAERGDRAGGGWTAGGAEG
jgi:hypothetical protein